MKFPEFLTRKEEFEPAPENKKGQGFRFTHLPRRENVFQLVQSRRAKIAALIFAVTLALFFSATHINGENAFLLLAVLGVGALVVYDIASRRGWEKTIAEQIQTLGRNHDRLVREVARTRTDVAIIKEGLHDTSVFVQDMGKNHAPSTSIEAKMIEAIITQLGNLGQKPRASLPNMMDATLPALAEPDPIDAIMQLEVAPPPRIPRPIGALEAELSPNFEKFSDTVILELVRHAVRQDHIDVFVQPIVNLPQRKLRMYEVYARLRAHAGSYIPAGRYLELALKESLVPAIDNLLLLRCLQILRDRRDDDFAMPYILNISSTTLHDTGFMNDLVVFLSQYRSLANRLIFELPLQEIEDAEKILIEIIDGLSKLGCRFSVDQIRKRRIDINMLRARHIRFIKLDAEWLLREAAQEGGQARITKLKKMLDRAGLDLIVEKIEKEKELRNLLDFGIDYGQGFYFGKPDLHAVYRSKERRESVA